MVYFSLGDFLNNESFRMMLLMAIFFAVLYFAVHKRFGDDNKAISIVVSLALSILVVGALWNRGYLQSYYGDYIGDWVIAIGFLVLFGFLIKLAYEKVGPLAAIFVLICFWLIVHFSDPYTLLSFASMPYVVLKIYEFVASIYGLLIVAFISAIILFAKTNAAKLPVQVLTYQQ